MVFNNYAKYYNLLYSDKDYKSEIEYIDSLIRNYSTKGNLSVLDAGCGTGRHANYLAEKGYHVTGIDRSAEMIEIANKNKNKNTEFHINDITDFVLNRKFDVVLALFHVASYQTTNIELSAMLSNIFKHLKPGGIFIFDFWYTPAVFIQNATVKIKRLSDNEISIVRISEPVHHYNENIIDVNFELLINDKKNNVFDVVHELHKMRYFSIPELDFILNSFGMSVLRYEEWLTGKNPSQNTWGVCSIAKIKSI